MNRTPQEPRDIPKGFRAYLSQEAEALASTEASLVQTFANWGYERLYTPSLEYEDVIGRGLNDRILTNSYRIIDTLTGRVLLLRPDFTPSIARAYSTATTQLGQCARLCYSGPVFRSINKHEGNRAQTWQAGCEFFGCDSLFADQEIIELCLQAVQKVNSHNLNLVLTHSGFIRGVLQALEVAPAIEQAMVETLHRKDATDLEALLAESGTTYSNREVLLKLPSLIGDQAVIEKARDLVINPVSLAALDELQTLVEMLSDLDVTITIDLSELSNLNYYTGCSFELYDEDCDIKVAGGGRYDNLTAKYDCPTPAVGFAINTSHLCTAGQTGETQPNLDYFVYSESDDLQKVQQEVQRLRSEGQRVSWSLAEGASSWKGRAVNSLQLP
ncbi:ATP phosphoribosyltransferase regulatory subunit [Desulfurispira natronophila]|uniref:ATP phosphoribosyltransferase regulatory subunit n=1 Tax=Desulfurispira natronophila TaxID=682562 RepID=A0A7W8DH32_9BACT|nr:ATP phosphoribosyltransferase regulatory subunit [Desulfurispira natronophila]MBB5021989.1 ATP phosphoribosyltransferase regulatory subunit [Desulfurispira natronophila]